MANKQIKRFLDSIQDSKIHGAVNELSCLVLDSFLINICCSLMALAFQAQNELAKLEKPNPGNLLCCGSVSGNISPHRGLHYQRMHFDFIYSVLFCLLGFRFKKFLSINFSH